MSINITDIEPQLALVWTVIVFKLDNMTDILATGALDRVAVVDFPDGLVVRGAGGREVDPGTFGCFAASAGGAGDDFTVDVVGGGAAVGDAGVAGECGGDSRGEEAEDGELREDWCHDVALRMMYIYS